MKNAQKTGLALTGLLFWLITMPALASEPLKIVASFTILGDLTKQIGGEHVSVITLVGADSDAHVFQPTPKDAREIANAKIVVINGLGFEGWMSRLIKTAKTNATIVTASDGIAKKLELAEQEADNHHDHAHHDEQGKNTDPHAWQNVQNTRVYVANIAKSLINADPTNAGDYQANAKRIDDELAALDSWVKDQIAPVPVEKRSAITSHDAFGYFADAYQVTFLAPQGLSTEDEPSAKELKTLIEQVKNGKTRALFIENTSNPNIIKQLSQESGAIVGPSLYADALSSNDGPAATYQKMFRYNVTALVQAMQLNP